MIQIRDIYQIKFGKVDQAVQLFKSRGAALAREAGLANTQVLVDMSGPMYTLITEIEADSLEGWESVRDQAFSRATNPDWFEQLQLLMDSGRREYYTVEQANGGWSAPGKVVVRSGFSALKWQIRPTVELLQRYGALLVDAGVGQRPRILTDSSGRMFTALVELETDGLSEWQSRRRELFRRPEFQVWFNQVCVHVNAGWHEFLSVA